MSFLIGAITSATTVFALVYFFVAGFACLALMLRNWRKDAEDNRMWREFSRQRREQERQWREQQRARRLKE